jgi:hypothetical protein
VPERATGRATTKEKPRNVPARVHDGIVERALSLGDELLSAATENERARGGRVATGEEVVTLAADLALLEVLAHAEDRRRQVVAGGLHLTTSGPRHAKHVHVLDSPSAEQSTVREILRRQIADRELRKDDVGATGDDLRQFVVNNVPLGVDDLLIRSDVGDADLGVVALGLQLELDVEQHDLRILECLGHCNGRGVACRVSKDGGKTRAKNGVCRPPMGAHSARIPHTRSTS